MKWIMIYLSLGPLSSGDSVALMRQYGTEAECRAALREIAAHAPRSAPLQIKQCIPGR